MKNPINMKTQANLVQITRFEAFALYKYYQAKAKEHKEKGATFFAEIYQEEAQKWLDIATEIESTNADKVNELLAG